MKIRNGFVSNSSSSSFILLYSASKATHDPSEIVKYLKDHPNASVLFRGGDICEGEDIFELDEDMKHFIRIFADEFIKNNTGTRIHRVYDDDYTSHQDVEVPKITAYLGNENYIKYDDSEYVDIEDEVDTSDIGECPENGSDEISAWYSAFYKKEGELRKTKLRDYIDSLVKEDINKGVTDVVGEHVYIDNQATDSIYDFCERYLTKEDSQDYQDIKRYYKYADSQPYLITYTEITSSKQDIIDYVEAMKDDFGTLRDLRDFFICRYNSALETWNDSCNLDLYQIGEDEAKAILKNKKAFLNSNYEIKAFFGCSVYHNGDDLYSTRDSKVFLGNGRVATINSGDGCLYDFKKTFLNKK